MRDPRAAARTLLQCVCSQHRNRIGRLSPFSEWVPWQAGLFAAIKSDPLPGLGAQHRSNGKLLAPCEMHIGRLMRQTYVHGNDVGVNRSRGEVSAEPGTSAVLRK